MKNKNKSKERYREEDALIHKQKKIALKRKKMELYEEEIEEDYDQYTDQYINSFKNKRK
jgi:hypothetical protein